MKPHVSSRQAGCLLLIFLTGWSLTMTAHSRSEWMSIALAAGLSLPLTALCCIPGERLPGQPLFERLRLLFGRTGSKIFAVILLLFAFWALCMAVLSGVIFLRTVSGNTWAVWLITAVLLLSAGVLARGGIVRLTVWAEPVVWVVLAGLLFSLVCSAPQWDWQQLLPLAPEQRTWLGHGYLLLSMPFAELFFVTLLMDHKGEFVRGGLLTGVVLAGVLLGLMAVRNVCVLGAAGVQSVQYPSYQAAGLLEVGKSFARGEVLISGALLFSLIARAAVLLCLCAQSVEHVLTIPRRHAVWLTALPAGIVCVIGAGSTAAFHRAETLYRLTAFPAVLVLAALFAAAALVRTKKRR